MPLRAASQTIACCVPESSQVCEGRRFFYVLLVEVLPASSCVRTKLWNLGFPMDIIYVWNPWSLHRHTSMNRDTAVCSTQCHSFHETWYRTLCSPHYQSFMSIAPPPLVHMQAIGMCPKEKLFKGYVQLERDLGEIDRCRKVYRWVFFFFFPTRSVPPPFCLLCPAVFPPQGCAGGRCFSLVKPVLVNVAIYIYHGFTHMYHILHIFIYKCQSIKSWNVYRESFCLLLACVCAAGSPWA